MPLVVEWLGPDMCHKQQPCSNKDKAEELKAYLERLGKPGVVIKTVAHVKTW